MFSHPMGTARLDPGTAVTIHADAKAVLLAAAAMFLLALALGVWKYQQMARSETHLAHPYVDTAHRAALLYSFAILLVATFVQLSGWSELVNLLAAGSMIFYFYGAVAGFAFHGWQADTENQFSDPVAGTHPFMILLTVAEIGGWLVLVAGFLDSQVF
jgi:hypothetical protein